MDAIFMEVLQQLNGAVFTLIVVLIAIFVLLYKCGGIVQKFKIFDGKNEKIDKSIDSIKDSLAKIGATTDLLYQAHLSTIQSHSPISLTIKGEDIAKAISAGMKISNHWQDIKSKLESKKPVNPYDIQVVAMDIAQECFEELFTPEEQNETKTFAFNAGINLAEIYPIFGVIIRDNIFKERGMNIKEIDKFNPANGINK